MIMYELAEIFFDAAKDNRKNFLKYPFCAKDLGRSDI